MVKAVGKNFLECRLSKLKYTKVYKVTNQQIYGKANAFELL